MKDYILLITMHADPAMPPGYDEWGGTHTYMKELLDIFGVKNIPCILITRKSMQALPQEEQYNSSCKIIRLINGEDGPMSKLELHKYHTENLNNIWKIIKEQESLPRIIHSVYWNSGRLAMELSARLNIPYVHSVISNSRGRVKRGAKEPLLQREHYEQNIYNHASIILCVSEDEKKDLTDFYGISADKLIVCGQFIAQPFQSPAHDTNGFPRLNSKLTEQEQRLAAELYNNAVHIQETSDKFWLYKAFTYLGRMDENKGVIQILQAWYALNRSYKTQCPPLWMVGGSVSEIVSIRNKAKKYIPELPALEENHRLVWWGYLDVDGLSTVLLKTQVVITHSLYEPGGRVAIEAMRTGVPVIATPNGFAKDAIRDWKNGFLVTYGDTKELSARMEHFIRQPLLGNSLGLNARESAKTEIENWAFEQNHLYAYGIVPRPIKKNFAEQPDYYAHRIVHLYPYCIHPLTDQYISNIFQTCCHKPVISINDIETGICTSDMKLLVTLDGEFIVKHVFTRLATSPFYNPFLKEQLVRDAQQHFEIELNVYECLDTDILACADPFHHLLYLRKLSPLNREDKDYLKRCLVYLANRKNILTSEEIGVYKNLLESPIGSFDEAEAFLKSLNEQFPKYYFECSGMFSNYISWTIAPYLLSYNKHVFDPVIYAKLQELCEFYQAKTYLLDDGKLRNINLDIEQRHLMEDKKGIHLIDHEKTSIGIVEMDIASFLCDYCRNTQEMDIAEFLKELTPYLKSLGLETNEIVSAIAYRFFYDSIVDAVMKCRQPINFLSIISSLKSLME